MLFRLKYVHTTHISLNGFAINIGQNSELYELAVACHWRTSNFVPQRTYSKRPKSEHVRISDRCSLFGSNFCSVVKKRRNLNDFVRISDVWLYDHTPSNVRISDKLPILCYKTPKSERRMNRTSEI